MLAKADWSQQNHLSWYSQSIFLVSHLKCEMERPELGSHCSEVNNGSLKAPEAAALTIHCVVPWIPPFMSGLCNSSSYLKTPIISKKKKKNCFFWLNQARIGLCCLQLTRFVIGYFYTTYPADTCFPISEAQLFVAQQ